MKSNFKTIENVEITGTSSDGKAITRQNDIVIFVEGAVPGDIGDISIKKSKKSFKEGRLEKLIKPSEDRVDPFCEHFGVCGGCKWQNMNYEAQLKYKQQQVFDALTRIGKIKLPEIAPILPSPDTRFYRNKLEFTFTNNRWLTIDEMKDMENQQRNGLGFHTPNNFSKVIEVNKCWLQADPSNEIRLFIKDYALENKLTFFDLRKQEGLLRNLIVRTANTGELMVLVSFFRDDKQQIEDLLNRVAEKFPAITSLMYVINPKGNDTIFDLEVKCFKGNDHIVEEMPWADDSSNRLQFKVGAKSFFQTNSKQAFNLYKITFDFAEFKGDELVYDLYTGTGTIANFIAQKVAKVIVIEYVADAINDARKNALMNGISNATFFAGDMKDVLSTEFVNINGVPDVIITDPPRAGMHDDVVNRILEIAPEKIVYVSCNPATQARDLNLLDVKYEVIKIQPVDMFPQTHHVENVALLKKRI